MSYTEREIEYRGLTIKIIQDEDAQSPKDWENDDAFLVYDHRDFNVEVKGFDPTEIFEYLKESKKKMFPVLTYAKRPLGLNADSKIETRYDYYWVFPVYAYIHSGVSLSLGRTSYPFNDRWDVSFKGFALVKRQKGWTWTEEKAHKVAGGIVEEWNDYLSGNVYGFEVLDKDENSIDSCWGFYGDPEKSGAIDDAKAYADAHIREGIKKHIDSVKQWIVNKVALIYREPFSIETI